MRLYAVFILLCPILLTGCIISHTDTARFYEVTSETPEGKKAIEEYGIKYLSKSTYGIFWSDFYRKKGEFVYNITELMDGSNQYKVLNKELTDTWALNPDFGIWNFFSKLLLVIAGAFFLIKSIIKRTQKPAKRTVIGLEYSKKIRNLVLILLSVSVFASCENTQKISDKKVENIDISYPSLVSIEKRGQTKEGSLILLLKLQVDTLQLNCYGLGSQDLFAKIFLGTEIINSIELDRKEDAYLINKLEMSKVTFSPFYWLFSKLNQRFTHDKAYNISILITASLIFALLAILVYKVGLIETIFGIINET